MKTNYVLGYLFIALLFVFTSCSKDENEVFDESEKIVESDVTSEKTVEELDFIGNDGSIGLTEELLAGEEDAPVVTNVQAKSYRHYNYTLLKPSDVTPDDIKNCGETTTLPLLVGSRKKNVGEVTVSNDGENLYLTFTANSRKLMKKVYLYIGEKGNIPFYSNGFPNLRKFNYKAFPYYYGGMKKATYVIPLSSINLDCFEIVAYAKIYDKNSRCYYSAFAYDSNRTQEYTYSYYSGCYYYGDWVRSFEYCKQSCEAECIQAYGFHEACGFCEDNTFTTFLAYTFINSRGDAGVDIELIINPDGCDITNSSEVGHINISAVDDTKLKVVYQVTAEYEMCALSFSYGSSKDDITTNYSEQFDTATTTHSFEIDRLPGANIFMHSTSEISNK